MTVDRSTKESCIYNMKEKGWRCEENYYEHQRRSHLTRSANRGGSHAILSQAPPTNFNCDESNETISKSLIYNVHKLTNH